MFINFNYADVVINLLFRVIRMYSVENKMYKKHSGSFYLVITDNKFSWVL